jgi:hypothetical protein
MDAYKPKISFARSLLWLACFAALAAGVTIIVSLILIDFVHGNPDRPKSNALFMMFLFPPIMGLTFVITVFLVFAIPQFLQALLVGALFPRFGRSAFLFVLLVLPVTATIAWYCYDYLIPAFNLGINEGADWRPYQHGITWPRYEKTLASQAVVTTFTLLYSDAVVRRHSRKPIILGALILFVLAGTVLGAKMAQTQIGLIEHRNPT